MEYSWATYENLWISNCVCGAKIKGVDENESSFARPDKTV